MLFTFTAFSSVTYINFSKLYIYIIPSCSIRSAISSAEIFVSTCCHFSLLQISNLESIPTITTSFLNSANSLRLLLIKNLPCLSRTHSIAPAKKNLEKLRASLLLRGSERNFSSNFFHSFKENANNEPSKPLVTMNFSPISSLNFEMTQKNKKTSYKS